MSDAFQIRWPLWFQKNYAVLSLIAHLFLLGPFLLIPSPPKHSLNSSSHSQETEPQSPADKRAGSPACQSVGSYTSPVPGFCFVSLTCVSADGPVRYYTPGW